jgi:hypothetical protein
VSTVLGWLFGRIALACLLANLVTVGIGTADRSSAAAPSGPVSCSLKHLSVFVASGAGAGGSEGMLVAFRNNGSAACVLSGYPRVVAKRPGASVTALPKENTYLGGWMEQGSQPPTVELQSHRSASVVIAADDNPASASSRCAHQRYQSVVVSLPGSAVSKRLSAALPNQATTLPSCSAVVVTPFVSGLSWEAPSPGTPTTVPPQGGYRGIENFCAVKPLTGTILYDGTSREWAHVLTLTVGGLPPNDEIYVNWSNDRVRAPVIAGFKTDSQGTAIQSSVDVGRLGEVKGVEIVLSAAGAPNPVLGRLEPC